MLETIWFVLWAILWAVYFMLDGFDLGIGALMPVLAKTDDEKRTLYNATGPFWDGNEVWLITAGGVTFAAFPGNYAVMFSALYSPLMLILFALIIRGISFEFRSKLDSPAWKKIWDTCMIVGSLLATILFGVAFANIFSGIPIDSEGVLQGNIISLLTPYGLLGGMLFFILFTIHGAVWLVAKTDGEVNSRSVKYINVFWPFLVLISLVFLLGTAFATSVYENYVSNIILFAIPVLYIVAIGLIRYFINNKQPWKAWFSSSAGIVMLTLFGLVGIFPRLLPSSINDAFSMTINNSASSEMTLKIMLGVVLVFIPIVIGYQTWVYFLFKDKVKKEDHIY